MRLHRLVLTNYRGIEHREVTFPERGVVIVSGANEIGKSSMVEALDLLIDAKDRSKSAQVKAVKPTHADVGTEVTAEISTGPYHFVYRKRFHKRPETELTVLAPVREQLTGDEAHERVLVMLNETVDMDLWRAQRVLQAASTAPVDLSGCDALSRALDVAAGEAAHAGAADPLLIDRIEEEYRRYFTPTGKPTGEWAAVGKRLEAAKAEVKLWQDKLAEVDEATARHDALTEQLADLTPQCEAARQRLAQAQQAAAAVEQLTRRVGEAEHAARTAEAVRDNADRALAERRRLRGEVDERASGIAELQAAAEAAAQRETAARAAQQAAEAAADAARAAADAAYADLERARQAVRRLEDRDEAEQLADRLSRIDAARRELDRIDAELADNTVTDAVMQAVEAALREVERAAAQVEAASAHIELAAAADVELRIDGEPVRLSAGGQWDTAAATPTEIDLPGLLRVRVVPGAPAADTTAKLDAAQHKLDEALRAAGAADVEAARAAHRRRAELTGTRQAKQAELGALIRDDDVELLRARLAELRAAEPGPAQADDPPDLATARADLQTAEQAYRTALADSETHRKAAAEAAAGAAEAARQATAAREKLAAAQQELTAATERLAAQRAETSDDELIVRAQAAAEQAEAATAEVARLRAELAAAGPDAVTAALDEAQRAVDGLERQRAEADDALREVAAALKVYGSEGRKGRLDEAETELTHARAEHDRVGRRARAAKLLRDTVLRHRDTARQRYVEPFRGEVERLGRLVFGESLEVEVDNTLAIRRRTLDGRTVEYEALSGGAKEQLGIITRLAGAALVGKDDSVPVVIDDALGFTDAERLRRMGAVFDAVGTDAQVIVLTCSPERYAAIDNAHRIELSA
ncbi:AAA family ATPase [uncultured Mycolicibacterium sp.]|mgnify:CR=1 FL=1|uniref:AAA family ATPase n=1 Tax=uncultured Mycolicibacterium sp. TaxID=2320817 RepID=UPI00261B6AD3|nr:AAA family ATPase [uncultured Mycolicibacterium sp.]